MVLNSHYAAPVLGNKIKAISAQDGSKGSVACEDGGIDAGKSFALTLVTSSLAIRKTPCGICGG